MKNTRGLPRLPGGAGQGQKEVWPGCLGKSEKIGSSLSRWVEAGLLQTTFNAAGEFGAHSFVPTLWAPQRPLVNLAPNSLKVSWSLVLSKCSFPGLCELSVPEFLLPVSATVTLQRPFCSLNTEFRVL